MEKCPIYKKCNGCQLMNMEDYSQQLKFKQKQVSRLFEGTLISCDAGIVKPDPRIYRLFTERFSLQPDECLFIDDQPPNVAAAIRAGWSGIVFQGSAEDLRERIAHLLKNG